MDIIDNILRILFPCICLYCRSINKDSKAMLCDSCQQLLMHFWISEEDQLVCFEENKILSLLCDYIENNCLPKIVNVLGGFLLYKFSISSLKYPIAIHPFFPNRCSSNKKKMILKLCKFLRKVLKHKKSCSDVLFVCDYIPSNQKKKTPKNILFLYK